MSCSTNSYVITQKQRRTCGSSGCSCTRQTTFSTEGPICCNSEPIENQWIKYIPTITCQSNNPSLSISQDVNEAWYLVQGKVMFWKYRFQQLNATGATTGTGQYQVELPSGFSYYRSFLDIDRELVGTAFVEGDGDCIFGTSSIALTDHIVVGLGDYNAPYAAWGSILVPLTTPNLYVQINATIQLK